MSESLQYPMSSEDIDSETNEMNMKEEISSNKEEIGQEFIVDVCPTETPSIIDDIDMEIKYEEVDFHHNSTAQIEDRSELDIKNIDTLSSIAHVDCDSAKVDYLDLLQGDRDCETCQKYIRLLNIHIRAAHAPAQSLQDPLQIDPLNIDVDPDSDLDPTFTEESSSIQIRREVNNDVEKMRRSEEKSKSSSDSDPDFEVESGSESDPDYRPHSENVPHYLARKVRSQGRIKNQASSKKRKNVQLNRGKMKKVEEDGRKWKCNECAVSFVRKIYLKKHMLLHSGEKPFKCNVCKKTFSLKGSLIAHKRTHTGKTTFQCKECDQSFSFQGDLTRHVRTHTGEKPFVCDKCGKGFTINGSLNIHMRIHTGEKPFKCNMCEMAFAQSNSLIQHKRQHTGVRPYKCDECRKSFTASSHLIRHKQIHN